MTNVPWTFLERPIIWSHGLPATGSRRRPVEVPIQNFWIFILPVKSRDSYLIQGLLLFALLKNYLVKMIDLIKGCTFINEYVDKFCYRFNKALLKEEKFTLRPDWIQSIVSILKYYHSTKWWWRMFQVSKSYSKKHKEIIYWLEGINFPTDKKN